ncbi:hypothetical protein ZIOFF_022298 [Zingiber officinale]|uniref:Chromo domain-containing protein n=1 Tax=Zingiber officinale TaxID=94328 RepID=A0A8J5HCS3_ZINOF|nr:hypothetical protein ZIOFF_022298 [Zingiber officinale]
MKKRERYVIDSGFVKQRQYNPSTGMYSLDIVQISSHVMFLLSFLSCSCVAIKENQMPDIVDEIGYNDWQEKGNLNGVGFSMFLIDGRVKLQLLQAEAWVGAPVGYGKVQADQRAGRAGRTRPGKCYRLYPISVYNEEFLDATIPEIQRSSLAGTVLYLKSLSLSDIDILKFDFLDPPSRESLEDALRQLYLIDAIDENGQITDIGKSMAELPLEPSLARTLIEANELGCLSEALTVAAMLSAEVTIRPSRRPLGSYQLGIRASSFHLHPIVSRSNFNKRMVLTRLQEKKIHSVMATGGSHPDAKWALEFEAKHETRMDKLEKTMASLVTIVQELKDRLEADSSSSILIKKGINQQSRQHYDQGANSNEDREHNHLRMKVEFPRWENNDPIGWISRAEKYFRFHGTSDNAKVELASINLEGDAIQWYDWLEACHGPPKWEEFKEEFINRFGPSGYENVDGELAKIRQTSTVLEYQGRFERLSNRTRDWSEKQLLGTFIEGLRLDIRREAALSFARLQEEKINEEGRRNNKVIRENSSHYSTPRRLTKEEIKERMAKGLCWHCNEKWHRGHQCKQKRILMIEPIENSEEEDDFYEGETQDNINEVQDDSMAISVHALEGLQTPQIMKVKGFIKKQPVMILIDSGSTNNFLDSTLARRLKQKIERASTFDVKVADGRSLTSPGKCEGIKIILPNYELITDLFLLPLDGCDVVLGAQWLRTLGDIIWNFSQLTMRFQDQGKEVCIRGKRQDTITSISSYQAERLLKKDCSIFLMQLSIKKDHKGTLYTPPELEILLSKFSMIFAEPKGLPPSRSHDHRIPLIPGSAPANVRPYRYPYIQKENYLRCLTGDRPKEWVRWLPWAEWWYNTTYHSATKITPFEAVYGCIPPSVSSYTRGSTNVHQVDQNLRTRDQILQLLKNNLCDAQARIKQLADMHRSEREFAIGDWVFLKLQPYKQVSIRRSNSMKLSPKFYGPYKVMERIGPIAYRLELPRDSKIHPVFHVSCLKKKLGDKFTPQQHLPEVNSDGEVKFQPYAILERRLVKKNNQATVELLIQWDNLSIDDATWELYDTIQEKFPEFIDKQP